jgi:hypothetical protein
MHGSGSQATKARVSGVERASPSLCLIIGARLFTVKPPENQALNGPGRGCSTPLTTPCGPEPGIRGRSLRRPSPLDSGGLKSGRVYGIIAPAESWPSG